MREIDDETLLDIIENEGLEYTITGYLSPESVKNPKLFKLFKDIDDLYKEVNVELDKLRKKHWEDD